MPKYTVYGSDVTFYWAEVEAESPEAIYKMETDDFDWTEIDVESIQINSVELDGKRVSPEPSKSEILLELAQDANVPVINIPLSAGSDNDLSGFPTEQDEEDAG